MVTSYGHSTMTFAEPPRPAARTLEEIAARLTLLYGGIVGGVRLTHLLGYPSQAAFRKAVERDRLPVPVFTIAGRRGKFAQVEDIASWLHRGGRERLEELIERPGKAQHEQRRPP
jgi:hypothetical protein